MKKVAINSFLVIFVTCMSTIYVGCMQTDNKTDNNVPDRTGVFTATLYDVNEFVIPNARITIAGEVIRTTDSEGMFEAELSEGVHEIKVFVNDTECYSGELVYENYRITTLDIHTSCSLWSEITNKYAIVDDYEGTSSDNGDWYYSRIGADRGTMGDVSAQVYIGSGNASASVARGWGGVWSSMVHNAELNDGLNPKKILGPYIKNQYQPTMAGVEIDLSDGIGAFKIELKGKNNELIGSKEFTLTGGQRSLVFSIAPEEDIAVLNWLVDGSGSENENATAIVEQVRLVLNSPEYVTPEAVFLYSYGHLSQCYDDSTGWVRDRARWPSDDFSSVQAMGTFSLATAIAQDLGYIDFEMAKEIITKIKDTIISLPTYNGILPHFITNGKITSNTEWSSVDTAIALISGILACQAVGVDTTQLEEMVRNIDWNALTGFGSHPISHGYDYSGNLLSSRWDVFGSEFFTLAVAYASGTGRNDVQIGEYSTPPTWDGSGFNDEMASLFFPMQMAEDKWGNDWSKYRDEAAEKQVNHFSGHRYEEYGLFGLSASEVPDPWNVNSSQIYGAWGVGGHNNGGVNDGVSIVGYPVIAPHYAALISSQYPYDFDRLFKYIMEEKYIFTSLNNVESFGLDDSSLLKWNSLKGSWNLSLQILGVGRTLSKGEYLPYRALSENSFLSVGYGLLEKKDELCEENCSLSGACSSHGGVNCALGPDVDGSVICHDGWTDSSIQYHCNSLR